MKKKRLIPYFACLMCVMFFVFVSLCLSSAALNLCVNASGTCRASCLQNEASVADKDCDINGNGQPNEGALVDGICCTNMTDTSAPVAKGTEKIEVISISVNPDITVVFSEMIFLKSAKLYALNEQTQSMISLGLTPPPLPMINTTNFDTVTVKPVNNLPNGLYELELKVEDLVGNPTTAKKKFVIEMPETEITILEPHLGVSNGSLGNLTVETSENGGDSVCGITTSVYNYDLYSNSTILFDYTDPNQRRHTLYNFFKRANFNQYAVFYILCKDTYPGRINRKKAEIYIDMQAPSITKFVFNPPMVVEYPEFESNLFVNLNVSTNEPTLCKYSFNKSRNYTDMTEFPGFDRNDFNAYNKSFFVKYYLPAANPAAYNFFVQCEDRAGWRTSQAGGILKVDLSAGLGISVIEPRPATTNKTITLVATTVKRTGCEIGNDTKNYQTMATDTSGKRHSFYLGTFEDGSYTYHIHCVGQSVGGLNVQEQTLAYTFVVDNTKPEYINATGSTTTCFANKLSFMPPLTFIANDSQSGIDYYLFKVETGTTMIKNWTKTKDILPEITADDSGKPLNITQAATYRITAKAVNGAGSEGDTISIDVVYDPQSLDCFEKTPPMIILVQNKTQGRTLVEFACRDESGCNNQSFFYGLSATETCEPAQNVAEPFIITLYQTSYVCYNISDIHGYSATGTEKVDVNMADTCSDTVKDGNETDIDCGGGCGGCDLQKSCMVKTDCKSNFCPQNVCIEAACDDNMTNGPYGNEESDVDCGGHCGSTCNLNQTCNNDGDCMNKFCNPDRKACEMPTCDDSYKNGDEEGVDCGGSCNVNCNDKNGNGIDDAWEQQYCNGECDPNADSDGDGLTNMEEFKHKTNPLKADTDGDGYSDGKEVEAGTDPLNPNDYPKSYSGMILLIFGILMILGGSGYLAYKRYYLARPAPGQAASTISPEELERRRKEEEARQRAMIEQRRKELEERQRRMIDLKRKIDERRQVEEKKKKEEREKLFKAFGAGPGGAAAAPPKAETITITPRKPAAAPQRMAAEAAQKEEWMPISKLKGAFSGLMGKPEEQKKETLPEKQKPKTEEEAELDKLEELAGEEKEAKGKEEEAEKGGEDVFGEMEEISKEAGEKDRGEEEDIYRGLEDVGKDNAAKKKKK